MNISLVSNIILIIVLTLLSGFGDSQGFIHASRGWVNGLPVWKELAKSALWFGLGITTFLGAIRFMREVGIVLPEIQTAIWFLIVIVGVAILAGHFFQWERQEQVVAFMVVAGIGWLIFRTST